MGSSWSVTKEQPRRVLILGLDAAGKTTLLYHMKLGEVVNTIPTIGFNVEQINHKSVQLVVWDVGGRDKIRPLYRHYFQNTEALMYVVDSNDRERFCQARDELQSFLTDEKLSNVPLLIVANKQDLPGAAKSKEIAEELGLYDVRSHLWTVVETSAIKSEGLLEIQDRLASLVTKATVQAVAKKVVGVKDEKDKKAETTASAKTGTMRLFSSAFGVDFLKVQFKKLMSSA